MKRAVMFLGMLLLGAVLGWGQETDKKAETAKPISALSWLVGGVWTADASKMGASRDAADRDKISMVR